MRSSRWVYLLELLAFALAYALLGRLGLLWAPQPILASPIYPAAGFALALLCVHGLRHAPAVLLGASLANHWLRLELDQGLSWAPLLIGIGATVQAGLGAWLVRRQCGVPLVLERSRDIAAFALLGVGVAGLVSPSVATLALWWTGTLSPAQLWTNWSTWWVGDTLGALIAAPICLTLLGQPRSAWANRRLSVGLPMLAMTALAGLGAAEIKDWDQQRARADFERDAQSAVAAVEALLREPLVALDALHGLAKLKPTPSRDEFARGTSTLLQADSPLLALGIARRVARNALPAFNLAAQADGMTGYQARDRARAGDLQPPPDEDMLAIRWIEPRARNASALGVNIRTIPSARAATALAASSGRPVASAGFQLSQDREVAIGVVIYQALSEPAEAVSPEAAAERLSGVAFATLRPDLLLSRVALRWPSHLEGCLIDQSAGAPAMRLAGRVGCENLKESPHTGMLVYRQGSSFAGRDWLIQINTEHSNESSGFGQSSRSWPFALVGLFSCGLIGMLLLLVSGRAQQVSAQVRERTAALEHEISEREHSELALRQSEERFRSIFEHAPIGIAFTDVNGHFQEVNPRFCELVGYPNAALMRVRSVDVTHPDDRAEDVRLARQLLRGEALFYKRRKRYLTADGREIQVRALVSLLRGVDGRPHRLVGVVEDVTDELRVQAADRARAAAESANQAKNEFLSRMSHELRTPMNAILGFTQLMEMDANAPLPPEQAQRARQISQAGWHLLAMINDTLDLSRIDAGSLRLNPAVQSLPALVERARSMIQGMADERRLQISQDIASDAGRVFGDATRITQILTNLLSNAVKYNRDDGRIDISARRLDADWVQVEVRDTGIGLSAAQRQALFQPFNRLGHERSGIPGTGIGLVISRRLAEMMGGSLDAAEASGPGSAFVLRLPVSESAAAATDAAK